MKRYSMYIDEAEEKPDGGRVKWEDANARVAELEGRPEMSRWLAVLRERDAANARVAELESAARRDLEQFAALVGARDAANARADAAERLLRAHTIERDRAESEAAALRARIALAVEVADNCSGDYMRSILSGEIDLAEHKARKL